MKKDIDAMKSIKRYKMLTSLNKKHFSKI